MPINAQNSSFSKLSGMRAFVWGPYAVLILSVLLAYANVYGNSFLLDDFTLISENKFLTSWRFIGTLFVTHAMEGGGTPDPFYRPLQLLLYLFVHQTAGPSAVGFHLLNVTLHILNACLLYTLGLRLRFQRIAALLATLVWALHPVQSGTVACMGATADLLCGFFILAGIMVLAPEFNKRRVLSACFLFALALLSKETAVVFPLLAMGLLFYRSESRWSPRTYLKTWPFWVTVSLYLLARITVLDFYGFSAFFKSDIFADVTIADRFYTFLATLPVYIRLLVWPACLHMLRSFPTYTAFWSTQVIAGLAVLISAFTAILWKPSRHATPLAWGMLWAAAAHIPQSGILVRVDSLIAESWLYLPTMGIALGLGESLARLSGHMHRVRQGLAALTVLIILLFSIMTLQQIKTWRDAETFYTHILDCGEDTPFVRYGLGVSYFEKGQYEMAVRQYRSALTLLSTPAIVADNRIIAAIHYNLAIALIKGDPKPPSTGEIVQHLQNALALNPDYYKAADVLANVYAYLGDHVAENEYRAKASAIRKKLGVEGEESDIK